MEVRLATAEDVELTYGWAKDPLVRQNSYSSADITPKGHTAWFLNKLDRIGTLFLIFEVNKEPVGLVRFESNDDHFVVGITVAPDHRGKGYASDMLTLGLSRYVEHWKLPVYAYIKKENLASVKAFERAGFKFAQDLNYLGAPSKLYIWKSEDSI